MKKYDIHNPTLHQKEIEVIRYSKCVPGHLNREFIPLFHYLGVKEEVFFDLQQETFNRINDLNSFFSKKGAIPCS